MDYIMNSGIVLVIITVIIFLSKNYIIQYITRSVAHRYDKEIEKFRAVIQEKENEQKQFHELLMYTITHENKELKQRKIFAIDNLWKSFLAYKTLSIGVKFLSRLNIENILAQAADPKIQQFIRMFPQCSLDSLKKIAGDIKDVVSEESRPWLTHKAWSLYLTYTMIIFYAIYQFENVKAGGGINDLFDEKKLLQLMQAALPNLAIKEINNAVLGYLHDLIELELLNELKSMVENNEDSKAINRAKTIYTIASDMKKTFNLNPIT